MLDSKLWHREKAIQMAQTAPASSATVQVMSKYMLFVIRLFARLVTPCSLTGDLIIVGCSDGEKNKQTKKLNYN